MSASPLWQAVERFQDGNNVAINVYVFEHVADCAAALNDKRDSVDELLAGH